MKMKKFGMILLLVLVLAIAAVAVPAFATESDVVYVKGGSNGQGTSPDDAVGTLSAAINKLPSTGGTVVVCGDVSFNTENTLSWTAKSGKITVTGKYKGTNYGPTISFSVAKTIFNCSSEIEFDNLTFNWVSGASMEFWSGPSLTIGSNVTFKNNRKDIQTGQNDGDGVICFRMGNVGKDCAESRLEIFSGRFSYIQGGNKDAKVTKSTVKIHPGVQVMDFIQCGGTNKEVSEVDVTIDGAKVHGLYLGGYGSGVAKKVTVNAVNADITYLYGQRSTKLVQLGTTVGTISGDADVTLDNTPVGTMDLSKITMSGGTRKLTLKNHTDLTVQNALADWTALELKSATVFVDAAYAGPAVTADASSLLIVRDDTTTLPAVTDSRVARKSDAVVYVSGEVTESDDGKTAQTAVKTMAEAYTKLGSKGGIIVVCGDLTMSYTAEKSTWPACSGGPVTITGADDAVLTMENGRSGRIFVLFTTVTKFSNIQMDNTNTNGVGKNKAVELWASTDLTFGEGVVNTIDGGIPLIGTTGQYPNGRWVVRIGHYDTDNQSGSFTMHSGAMTYIQAGNNKMNVTTSSVYIGEGATVVDYVQCGGTLKKVISSTVTIDGGEVNSLYLGGYSTSAAEIGNGVTVQVRNAHINNLYGQRNDTTVYTGTVKGILSLTLDGATVGNVSIDNVDATTMKLYLKNRDVLELGGTLHNWDELDLDNTILYLPDGYKDTLAITADSDSTILVDEADYPQLPVVQNVSFAYVGEPVWLDTVYVDALDGDDNNIGTLSGPVKTIEQAYKLLKTGTAGKIYIIGEYTIKNAPYVFPAHDKKVTICGTEDGAINFEAGKKTNIQFATPTQLENITVSTDHQNGNTNIYAGQELTVGENVTFSCTKCKSITDNCICIRGGYYRASYNVSDNSNTEINVYSGTLSYIQGGNDIADVGDVTIRFGGTAKVIARIQSSGSNGYDVNNVTIEISGGNVPELVLIGHGTDGAVAQVKGDSDITISGGTVTKIVTSRTDYEKHLGNVDLTISGSASMTSVSFNEALMTAGKTQNLIFSGLSKTMTLNGDSLTLWDSVSVEDGSTLQLNYQYKAPGAINVDATSKLVIAHRCVNPGLTVESIGATGGGEVTIGHVLNEVSAVDSVRLLTGYAAHYRCPVCDKYYLDADSQQETTLKALTENYSPLETMTYHDYVANTGYDTTYLMKTSGTQGNAIYGDTVIVSSNNGYAYMYDLITGNRIADFPLASYTTSSSGAYANHANQIMFGATKFDENDPFPLLYITTGNSGGHDTDGSYISKCSVERILYSDTRGWYAECVQIIQFNDFDCIPEQEGNPNKDMNNASNLHLTNMYSAQTGKFMYRDDPSTTDFDESKYQKVGWGWAASFVDSDPTEDTAGKFYLKGARFRTTESYQNVNQPVYGILAGWNDYYDVIGNNGETANAYIVTEFNMPALPKSTDPADGYGATVTLYPKDITKQFETEYEIGVTQGGTMYQGKIYYSYGWNGTADNLYTRNGIQVFDIAQEKIVTKLALYNDSALQPMEPECCSIWNGHLVLGLNGSYNGSSGNQIFVFDYVAEGTDWVNLPAVNTQPVSCTTDGCTYLDCSHCDEWIVTANTGSKLEHSFTNYVSDGNATCEADGTKTATCDHDGCEEKDTVTDTGSKREHKFTTYTSNGDATCEADGTKTAECDYDDCDEKNTVADIGSKLEHSFTDYKSDGNATCTADGTKTATCDRDGCEKTDTIKEAAHGHKLTKVDGKEATCTEAGVIEHYNCSVCKKNFADAEGKTARSTTVIPSCHSVEKVEGKAATTTENGLKEHYGCASCGKVYADAEGKTEVTKDSLIISATSAPTDTGDDFRAWPFVLLMLLSVAGVTVLVIGKKQWFRKNK